MSQKSPQGRFPPPDRRPAIRLRTLAPTALALSLLWAPASLAPAAIGDALPSLAPGLHFAHGLQGGESQRFPVSLDAGQFLRVVVTEEGIDVEVRLLDSEGQPAARVDGPRFPREPEDLAAVAGRPGPYTLEVRSLGVKDPAGRYRLEVDGPRQPTADDRARAEAVRLSQAAVDGMLTPGDESRRRQIALRERALPLWRRLGERRREADTLYQLGTARYRLRQYDEAGCDHHLAIALWRQLDDPSSLGETLREAGLVDRILGRTDEAAHHHTEALTIARRLGSRHLEELALNGLGSSEVDLGEARTAIAPLTEALAIARERRDGVVEASSLINLGAAYDELSEPQRAIPLYGEALTLARRLKDRDDEVTALNDLGTAYEALGDWDRALDDFEQALAMNRRLGDRAQEAATLNNLGLVYQHLERTPEALDAYGQAIARAAETHQPGTEATALDNLGFLHLAGREPEKALAECRQALVLAAGRRETEAAAHQALGRAYRQLGQLAAARAELSQALALSRDRGFRLREADVLRDLAQVARAEGDLPAALAFVRSAAGIVESLRAQVASPDLRASFLGSRRSCYEDYVDVLMALDRAQPGKGYLGEALRVSEQARARSLLEILNEAGADLLRGADPTLLERERRAREEISASALFRLRLLGGPASPEQAAEAARRLEAAVEEHDRIEAELRSASPRYAALTQPEILTLAQVQQGVLDRETLLLEYALGDEHSHLWVVAADAIHGFELPPRAAIEAEARSFYALLTARNDPPPPGESAAAARQRVERADRGLAQAATGLSRTVLPPAAAGLLADRRLVVVSDGALQYIPFGALPCPTDPSTGGAEDVPLVRRHEVVSLPSASVLAVLRRETANRPAAAAILAVLADPVFQADDLRLAGRRPAGGNGASGANGGPGLADRREAPPVRNGPGREIDLANLHRLRFSGQEADAIAALVPAGQRLKAVSFAASRATALSGELARYRLVHFATHGWLDSRHPELSGLVLSLFDERGEAEDGFLRLADIYDLELHADLVVLSACRTALGKEVRGEGLVGLTRGFMHAGAARVVASLWSVEDRATADLMRRFYEGMLRRRETPAAALREAQLAMAADPRWRAPYFWAGFSLAGEWR